MEPIKKLNGRPKLKEGKRTKFINVRFTEDEYREVTELEKELSVSKTDLIRMRILSDAKKTVINSRELIRYIDDAGAEMGRIGNNINQLAKHANTLKLKGALNPAVIKQFNLLFEEYISVQQQFEVSLRKIIRAMGA
ncbi:MobC family plasmid mobilization relaxosome protein [Mucilaginibacter sp. HC2]|uniref:plasmid mobilization protein n=1 Tax=Mucilaginibacter TaxID=423349 RepID=UPI000DCB1A58|nr:MULTISPECIES: plasmid mobilization relaxosome protein MobC [Mucilaginibacter]NHA05508.1 MobC family plasmid mobilization relaxosome protein [Mucilaginibacter inviolabilis]QTE35316.1 plasmid mobilization relaxosome protein MobC [Mucilaginibacter gossypii]RAV59481.1 plasmid mobilization relaxosome protein MobC [Mucilaginibacter rubeus]